MPQIFQVLRCYKCLVFQVHQTKKSNKWECKLCGVKQSVKRQYGIGTGKDCRLHVQKLNGMRGEIDEIKNSDYQETEGTEYEETISQTVKFNHQQIINSKWSNYIVEPNIEEDDCNKDMTPGDADIVLETPKKRRKLFHNNFKNNSKSVSHNHYKIKKNCKEENYSPNIIPKSRITLPEDNFSSQYNNRPTIAKSELHSEDLIIKQDNIANISQNTVKKKFVPPLLNKNSKWAQFTEDTEEIQDNGIEPSQDILKQTSQNDLFSLCNDMNLDDVLNI